VAGIDATLDALTWTPVPPPAAADDPRPYVTHRGQLTIGCHTLAVYRLSDGRRVIDERDFLDFFAVALGTQPPATTEGGNGAD
jgi:hypothetical protein